MKVDFTEVRDVQNLKQEDYLFVQEDGDWFLIIGRGECRSGGYDIRLEGLTMDGDVLTATVKQRDPEPGMMVTMAITYQTRKYRVDLSEKPKEISFQQASGQILKVIRN